MLTKRELLQSGAVVALVASATSGPALAQMLTGAPAEPNVKYGEVGPGPLRPHPDNPRYFTDGTRLPDGSLKAVFLTGSHTWDNLVDISRGSEKFDFDEYLDFLDKHNHNFIRLWAWEATKWDTRANGSKGKDFVHQVSPHPWQRTGPGNALDGKPKFDLTKLNSTYFDRLRHRVKDAGKRGIYVSVMFFEGWELTHGNSRYNSEEGWAWKYHPFNPKNNINSINFKGATINSAEIHNLNNPDINEIQEEYIKKVVDTVNDLDNVLYEVINEGGEKKWDWWVVDAVREYEKNKAKQHPVGITGHGAESTATMLASPADWVSVGGEKDPSNWREKKVSILDTDHIWGIGGDVEWVWKSFFTGHNPILMDPYDGSVLGKPNDPRWEPIRNALGQTRRLAERISLRAMVPHPELASTGFCLAQPGTEYLAYQPPHGSLYRDVADAVQGLLVHLGFRLWPRKTFFLRLEPGSYRYEWIDPADRKIVQHGELTGVAGTIEFKPPMNGAALVYLLAQ